MDAIIQAQLNGIETALNRLVDSIASYNPSIQAASTLLEADNELQNGLKQLQTHARNTARINSLRATISRQNEQITSHLTLLADTRADLLSVPTTNAPVAKELPAPSAQSSRPETSFTYTDLLTYASHLAKFNPARQTGPFSTRRVHPSEPTTDQQEEQLLPPSMTQANPPTAAKTENQPPPPPHDTAAGGVTDSATAMNKQEGGGGRGIADLTALEKQWLDPWTGITVTPWPGEDVLKRGGLAALQERGLAAGGDDDEMEVDVDGGEKAEEEVMKGVDAREDESGLQEQATKVEGEYGRNIEEREREKEKEKPRVFGGLDLYDPEEGDD